MRIFFIVYSLLVLLLLALAFLPYIDFSGDHALNNSSVIQPDNGSIIILPNNSSLINNSTTNASVIGNGDEPLPSSKYILYDNFSTANKGWTKRSNPWYSSYVNTSFFPSNVWIDDGKLMLYSNADQHVGGELASTEKLSYGKYRASIKLSQTTGTYETFFSYVSPAGSIIHNEIDVELYKSGTSTTASFTNLVNRQSAAYHYTLPFDPSTAYHVYGYNWYPDRVEYVIDDNIICTIRDKVPDEPMYVYFNTWVRKNVPADHGEGENYEYVDWVTVEPL
jgi:beta-glucanase (GH16 family)